MHGKFTVDFRKVPTPTLKAVVHEIDEYIVQQVTDREAKTIFHEMETVAYHELSRRPDNGW